MSEREKEMKYAIFDMDGTLTQSMEVWEEAPGAVLGRHGLTPRPDLRPRITELTQEDGCRLILEEYGLKMTLPQLVEEYYQVVEELYQKAPLKPGVQEALEAMSKAGVKMAVASSTRASTVNKVLTRLGVRPLFQGVFSCRDGLGKKKGPYVYQEAAQALGAENPGEVWVFEDAYHAVLSAKKGGFPVTGVYDPFCVVDPDTMAAACDRYMKSWKEFRLEDY